MGTRALTGLAAAVFTAGCALGAIGLHPAVHNPAVSRLGLLLAVATTPAWVAASTTAAARLTDNQLADAHMAGYQQCLAHLEAAADSSAVPPAGQPGPAETTERHDQ